MTTPNKYAWTCQTCKDRFYDWVDAVRKYEASQLEEDRAATYKAWNAYTLHLLETHGEKKATK